MEFNQKSQELRKKKELTQEELAEILYVSRTAISKWESGRGYPSIESIKEIAKFFSVTIDELLSSDEVLSIAEEDNKQKQLRFRSIVFGLLDISIIMFFFIPFFGQEAGGTLREVSLLFLNEITPYLRVVYYFVVIAVILFGIMTLVLQNCLNIFWVRYRDKISLMLNAVAIIIFIMSLQPYAATVIFIFLTIKVLMLIKL